MKQRHRRSAFAARVALPALFALLALGCSGTRLISGGPFAGVVQTPDGTVRYALAKSVVTIEATVTYGTSGQVVWKQNDFSVDSTLKIKDAKASVQISTVPDEDQFYTLRLEHGSSSDDSLSIEIAPNGMLRSIGASSTSQIATTAKNVVTIAAGIAATVAAAMLGSEKNPAIQRVCELLGSDSGTPGRCLAAQPTTPAPDPKPASRNKADSKPDKADPKDDVLPTTSQKPSSGCDKRTEISLRDLSMASLYFLARDQKHRRLWLDRRDTEALLQTRTCHRMELERTAEQSSSKDLDGVRTKLAMALQLEAAARADLRAVSDELDLAVRDFQLKTGIDSPARTEVVRMTFDLDDIPPPDMLTRAVSPEPQKPGSASRTPVVGMTESEVRKALESFPRMLELYSRTGIALTLTPPPYIVRGATVWTTQEPSAEGNTRIYYRPSYTAVLSTYSMSRSSDAEGGTQELLKLFAVASDDVVHRKMPTLGFSFQPTDFAERKIALSFDDKGRLTKLEQSGKSSLAGASSAAAESFIAARDQYTTTLSRIAEIQDTKRKLQQNDLLTELDRVQKQRDLVNARLELEGTRSNYDLLLEKKRLDAQLGVLQGRNDSGGGSTDNSAVSQEVADLRAKLDQLARAVDALQHRPTTTPIQTAGQ